MGKRRLTQVLWALVTNAHLSGFFTGKIYQGPLKSVCVPGLNCYSCPSAVGSCPIGALQQSFSSTGRKISFYVIGFLLLIGAVFGRFICGWLCPFGLIQELINKIPFPKKISTFRGDFILRKCKYIILLLFVIILPMFLTDAFGMSAPYFCKLICPVGTLEAGIPLVLLNQTLQSAIGFLYSWKLVILIVLLFLSILIYRPFCRYICPLGAIYSVFNPIALIKYRHEKALCTNCKICSASCKMNLDPSEKINHPECIHCGSCKKNCPTKAISGM